MVLVVVMACFLNDAEGDPTFMLEIIARAFASLSPLSLTSELGELHLRRAIPQAHFGSGDRSPYHFDAQRRCAR